MPFQPGSVLKVSPLKGVSVDDYVARKLNAEQAAIVAELRAIVRKAAPKSIEAVKWAMPIFEANGLFAYIKPSKNHVTFGFWRGAELSDPNGILAGEGDRMKHVKLASAKDINKTACKRSSRKRCSSTARRATRRKTADGKWQMAGGGCPSVSSEQ